MSEKKIIYHADFILPVEPNEILPDYCMLVDGNTIVELFPFTSADALREAYPGCAYRYFGRSSILFPGLVNTHTHLGMSLFRGVDSDHELLELGDWLQHFMWPLEGEFLSRPDFMPLAVDLGLVELLRHGVTTFCDQYFYPEVCAERAHRFGLRALVGCAILQFPTPYAGCETEYLEKAEALLAKFGASGDFVRIALAPHAPYTVSDAGFTRCAELMREHGELMMQVHLHEARAETEVQGATERPMARLDRLGVLGERTLAVHMVHLTPEERKVVVERDVGIGSCPNSNMKLGSGSFDYAPLRDHGKLALGTDSVCSNDELSLLNEARQAAYLSRASAADPGFKGLDKFRLLEMLTLGGARALRFEKLTGSLEAGKRADFVVAAPRRPTPFACPLNLLLFTREAEIREVFVDGKPLLEAGNPVGVDEDALAALWGPIMREVREHREFCEKKFIATRSSSSSSSTSKK